MLGETAPEPDFEEPVRFPGGGSCEQRLEVQKHTEYRGRKCRSLERPKCQVKPLGLIQ